MNHYEINVAQKNGIGCTGKPRYEHYFLATLRAYYKEEALASLRDFEARFPAPEFKVNLYYYQDGREEIHDD